MTVTAGATATFAALSELCIYSATVQAPWMPPVPQHQTTIIANLLLIYFNSAAPVHDSQNEVVELSAWLARQLLASLAARSPFL